MPSDPLLYLALMAIVLGGGVWLGWTVGAPRRREGRRSRPLPHELWLCDRCRSFNEPERQVCYQCRRERPPEAPTVAPTATFEIVQRFGAGSGDGGVRGPSRPWLGVDEPLRERWLATHPGPAATASESDATAPPPGPRRPSDETEPPAG